MNNKYHIEINQQCKTGVYNLKFFQRSIVSMFTAENLITSNIRKSLLATCKDGFLFELKTLQRNQSDITSNARKLENDMAFIYENLIIKTDNQGDIIGIQNLKDIEKNWLKKKKLLLKKYYDIKSIETILAKTDQLLLDECAFINSFRESATCTLLFPPIYLHNLEKDIPIKQDKSFSDFFLKYPLPVQLETTLKKYDWISDEAIINRKGSVAESFELYEVQKIFRRIFNNIRLIAHVQLDYLEKFGLNKYHWVDFATQIFRVRIKGIFSFMQLVQLTPLNHE